jgi:excisionase family DNA binding protein
VGKLLHQVSEAVELTGIGRSKLYELMGSGELESVKCGKRRLIPAEALMAFVERLRAEQRQPA